MARALVGCLMVVTILVGCREDGKNTNVIFPVTEIALKTPREVKEIAGDPDSVYTIKILGKPIYCQFYHEYDVEVQYFDGKATDIVVNSTTGLPFDQAALQAFGITKKLHPSDYKKGRYIRWTDTEQFSNISFYNPKFDSLSNIKSYTAFFKASEVK